MNKESSQGFLDEELSAVLDGVRQGGEESFSLLKKRYAPLIKSMAHSFAGGKNSFGELEREAEAALLKAAVSFDSTQTKVAFGLFAKICIRNALISVKRRESKSKKIKPPQKAAETRRAVEPQRIKAAIDAVMPSLSKYERQVLNEYLDGKSVTETASAVGRPKKSVNNALYRIREKLKDNRLPEEK